MKLEIYKLSGLLAFVIAWFGMLLAVVLQGWDKRKSISLHAASSRKTIILLAVLSPVSMALFMMFAAKWMAPTLGLSPVFITLNLLADAGYILAAWIPATGGLKTKLHNIFSYGASLLLVPVSFILATSPGVAMIPRIINAAACLVMVLIFGIMFLSERAKANYLYFQIIYFLAFDIGLLVAGYL